MPVTRNRIKEWFLEGKSQNARYMLVLCDTFDYGDYPSFFHTAHTCLERKNNPGEMQRVMECYDLNMDMETQLKEYRALKWPK